MPELPEVEAYRRLAERVVGREIAAVAAPDAWFVKGGTTPEELAAVLPGRRVLGARRRGKLLVLDLEGDVALGLRFGMTGTLVVDGCAGVDRLQHAPAGRRAGWERFGLTFVAGGSLVVHDPRRLGGVTLGPDEQQLGPDALGVTPGQLRLALGHSRAPLKARLLDQSVLAGVGNLVADEVLYRAGLSPQRPAGSLTEPELRRLASHLRRTLAVLLERGGSHLGDLGPARRRDGRCPRDGTPLARSTVGGRTTWWCPAHQR